MKEIKNVLIIVLFVIFLVLFGLILLNRTTNIVYIGNYTKVKIKNDKITIINKNSKVNLTKAKIYFNRDFVDGYIKSNKANIDNKANIYDVYNESGNSLRPAGDIIAYTGKNKIKIANINVVTLELKDDLDLISGFLASDNGNGIELDFSIEYKDYKRVAYDIDKDGDKEYIYSLEVLEGGSETYTYVFLVDDGEIQVINSMKGESNNVKLKKVSFFNLIDFDGDDKYEIVLRVKDGDYGYNKYRIYSYDSQIKEIK